MVILLFYFSARPPRDRLPPDWFDLQKYYFFVTEKQILLHYHIFLMFFCQSEKKN